MYDIEMSENHKHPTMEKVAYFLNNKLSYVQKILKDPNVDGNERLRFEGERKKI